MTTTLKLDAKRIRELRTRLQEAGWEFRDLQHAHYQARGPAVTVSAYKSGKVVVQGHGAATFLEQFGFAEPGLEGPVVGSDESGKGDYFGPLAVAAVLVEPRHETALMRLGVRDCKKMGDEAILRGAAGIRRLCPHAVRVLSPEEYNAHHEQEGNVALFLARLHAEVIAEAARGARPAPHVVIDQFTFAQRLEEALRAEGIDTTVEIRPRAEDNPAVAAASVLARSEFLLGLRELGNEFGVELPKGASYAVERAARRLFQEGGMAALGRLAKLHFKTTQRVTRDLF